MFNRNQNFYNNQKSNHMGNWTLKKIILTSIGAIVGIIALITFMTSWSDVEPGNEGFMYKPYGGGLQGDIMYEEGTYFVAPWNEMITYNVRQQSKNYESQVMDKNGTDITLVVSCNYSAIKGKTSELHLKHGPGYISFIDDKVKGAIKDVVGRYTYEEVYSTKREALEGEIEEILKNDFQGNYIQLHYVEIADVNLPSNIASEIVNKETQKQRNLTAFEKKQEEKYLADAKIEKARGDSSLVISANYKAEAIRKEAQQLKANPDYIEYIKWQGFKEGQGSPYGTNNVFGSGMQILKGIK
jgi:regulator of protease activity HflC (stomatin/prohibitin superfamily)